MSRIITFFLFAALLVSAPSRVQAQAREDAAPQGAPPAAQQPVNDDKHLVYADFEKADDSKKPVSARGGDISLNPYQSQGSREATAQGPELVHVKKDDPNHLLKFDYALFAGAEWTGVTLEVRGRPDVDGNPVPDDVSGYKTLSLDCYVTGVAIIRVQILDKGHGAYNATQPPEYTFKVKNGLNTYKIPLKAFSQPEWVKDERVESQGGTKGSDLGPHHSLL